MASVEDIIDNVINEWEGGFSNRPDDRGGQRGFTVAKSGHSGHFLLHGEFSGTSIIKKID